ncbi:MAG: glycosyltransferase family 4 protein [Ancalomicrobiaceae bacterium]|nr:glycosyltransferase family 4 protein [Ancalomicrobiaceae bacterium]
MKRFAFAIPGDLARLTGGYGYDRRVIAECRDAGIVVEHLALPGDFPAPAPDSLAASAAMFANVPPEVPILVDGLAFGALPDGLIAHAGRRFAALVHHPLALETGLSTADVARFATSERRALTRAQWVVATSATTARSLVADYGVDPARLSVAEPGIDPVPREAGSTGEPQILAVGSILPRKAYPVLIEALALIADLPWSCRIVGAPDADAAETERVRGRIAAHGLGGRIDLAGAFGGERLEAAFAGADVFAHPAYHEGYGMALAEALAHGLPIVASDAGAIPETVPGDAGLLVPAGDANAFAGALRRLVGDPIRRRAMADAAWAAGRKLPRWSATAATIVAALQLAERSQS